MPWEQVFPEANATALGGWVLLAALPGRRWVADRIAGLAIPLLLGAGYIALIVGYWSGAEGGFGSLAAVAALFRSPPILLAGWLHYLAFDLFIGAYAARQAQRLGIPHLAMLPSYALTFLFGPAGLLVFLVTRRIFAGRWTEG